MRLLLQLLLLFPPLFAIEIDEKPIKFGKDRVALTKAYIKRHYGLDVETIEIVPKMVVIHYTAVNDFNGSYSCFEKHRLASARRDIASASALNVSAHFLVDRDGRIYRLMPENWMARHVIGLNYSSIGIENVGGPGTLTAKQLEANVRLVRHLKRKYPTIRYLIGHSEYRRFEGSALWLEKDSGYRTSKSDPGEEFMRSLRANFPELKQAP